MDLTLTISKISINKKNYEKSESINNYYTSLNEIRIHDAAVKKCSHILLN